MRKVTLEFIFKQVVELLRCFSSSGVISVSCKQDEDAMDVVDLYAIVEYTCRLRETRTNCVKARHAILQQFMKRFKSREY